MAEREGVRVRGAARGDGGGAAGATANGSPFSVYRAGAGLTKLPWVLCSPEIIAPPTCTWPLAAHRSSAQAMNSMVHLTVGDGQRWRER